MKDYILLIFKNILEKILVFMDVLKKFVGILGKNIELFLREGELGCC